MDEDPQNALQWMNLFGERLREDRTYLDRLLLTLELNKIERDHQALDKPKIFSRERDDLGFTVSYTLHPFYEGSSLPQPKQTFTEAERRECAAYITKGDNIALVESLGTLDSYEEAIREACGLEVPAVERQYNGRRFVTKARLLVKILDEMPENPSDISPDEGRVGEWVSMREFFHASCEGAFRVIE